MQYGQNVVWVLPPVFTLLLGHPHLAMLPNPNFLPPGSSCKGCQGDGE